MPIVIYCKSLIDNMIAKSLSLTAMNCLVDGEAYDTGGIFLFIPCEWANVANSRRV